MNATANPSLMQQLIPLAIGMAVLGVVVLRNSRGRRLRLEWMWVLPLLITLLTVGVLWRGLSTGMHVGPVSALAWAASLAAGCAIGWWRGSLMTITVDPETETLTSRASLVGLLLIGGVFLSRYALRIWLDAHPGTLGMSAYIISDAFLLFAAGLIVTQRLEMWLRARKQLAEMRAGRTGGVGGGVASV